MSGSVASVHRERPLSLRLAAGSVALSAGDVNLVLQGIDALVDGPHASHLGELGTLRDELVAASSSLFAPPLRIEGDEARHARFLAREGGPIADVRRLLDEPMSRAANYASGVIVLAILALMVWQP